MKRGPTSDYSGDRLWTIQALRAIAALMVAVMHIFGFSSRGGDETMQQLRVFAQHFGHGGVDIFFVISGLIIVILFRNKPSAGSFIFRRAARIYPLFWITLAALLANGAVRGYWHGSNYLVANPEALFLLNGGGAAHPVSWTLVYEIHFYAVAAIALLFGRHAMKAIGVWCAIQAVLVVLASQRLIPSYVFFHPLTFEFMFGIFVGLVAPRMRLPMPLLFAAAGLAVPILANVIYGVEIGRNGYLRAFVWGLPSAILVWAALSWEAVSRPRPVAWAVYLGDISYSIYMWHWLVAGLLTLLWGGWLAGVPGALAYIAVTFVCLIAVSAVSYEWIERPINRRASWVASTMCAALTIPPRRHSPLPRY